MIRHWSSHLRRNLSPLDWGDYHKHHAISGQQSGKTGTGKELLGYLLRLHFPSEDMHKKAHPRSEIWFLGSNMSHPERTTSSTSVEKSQNENPQNPSLNLPKLPRSFHQFPSVVRYNGATYLVTQHLHRLFKLKTLRLQLLRSFFSTIPVCGKVVEILETSLAKGGKTGGFLSLNEMFPSLV